MYSTMYFPEKVKAGKIERLHQEDLCQVLGCMPDQKYENEGGPGLSECCQVLDMYSSQPILDKQALVKWVIFNSEFLASACLHLCRPTFFAPIFY
jgi:serine/threonine-protein kinase HipA